MTTITFGAIGSTPPRPVDIRPQRVAGRATGWLIAITVSAAVWGGLIAGVVSLVSALA